MTSENFVYWLQRHLELSKQSTLDEEQVKVVKEHIKLVLEKVTETSIQVESPSYSSVPPLRTDPLVVKC